MHSLRAWMLRHLDWWCQQTDSWNVTMRLGCRSVQFIATETAVDLECLSDFGRLIGWWDESVNRSVKLHQLVACNGMKTLDLQAQKPLITKVCMAHSLLSFESTNYFGICLLSLKDGVFKLGTLHVHPFLFPLDVPLDVSSNSDSVESVAIFIPRLPNKKEQSKYSYKWCKKSCVHQLRGGSLSPGIYFGLKAPSQVFGLGISEPSTANPLKTPRFKPSWGGWLSGGGSCKAAANCFGMVGIPMNEMAWTIKTYINVGGFLKYWYPTSMEVFLLKMIIFGVPPFKETSIYESKNIWWTMGVKACEDFWNFTFVSNFFGLFGTTSNSVRQTMSCHGSLGCSRCFSKYDRKKNPSTESVEKGGKSANQKAS